MLEPPRIKLCGLTDVDDALSALASGCDAIGLVEHELSPRCVDVHRAREIVAALDGRVLVVGVMVDRAPEQARAWLAATGADAVQLCGCETPDAWRGFHVPVLRRVAVDVSAESEIAAWREVAALFVLDHPSAPGGSGRAVEIARAAKVAAHAPCLLAGGLDDTNVAERIAAVRPRGVDASSRLETRPGRKDRERVARFVANARAALQEIGR